MTAVNRYGLDDSIEDVATLYSSPHSDCDTVLVTEQNPGSEFEVPDLESLHDYFGQQVQVAG